MYTSPSNFQANQNIDLTIKGGERLKKKVLMKLRKDQIIIQAIRCRERESMAGD